jgi:hypothetical protein
MKFPNPPRQGESVSQSFRELLNWIRANNITSVIGGRLAESPSGKTLFIKPGTGGGKGSAAAGTCYFGEIITWTVGETTKTGIRGGTIQAGDKNFNVPNKELNLASTGVTLIYLEIAVTANNDDAGEILLPGIETSTETTPSGFWKSASWTAEPVTQYPANTRPILTTGVGKIIIPIGKLTIAAGAATLEAVRCGNITINHCGGTLTAD